MAHFDDLDLGMGWWMYFQLRLAAERDDPVFIQGFVEEIERMCSIGEGSYVTASGKNDKKPKRVSMRRL